MKETKRCFYVEGIETFSLNQFIKNKKVEKVLGCGEITADRFNEYYNELGSIFRYKNIEYIMIGISINYNLELGEYYIINLEKKNNG